MGYLNLCTSLRYGPHGKKRKTKAFTAKKKKIDFVEYKKTSEEELNKLRSEQKKQYESLMCSIGSDDSHMRRKEPMVYTGERQLLGIATMHKSNMVPVFADDTNYAKDLARMRR
jgi:ABC-type oligopeptide transport system ATPase subunit